MRRGWIGAPALLALALARAPAQCDCPASSPKDHLQAATYVFTGTVSELDADRQTGVQNRRADPMPGHHQTCADPEVE